MWDRISALSDRNFRNWAVVVKNNFALHVGPGLSFIWPNFLYVIWRRGQEQPCHLFGIV